MKCRQFQDLIQNNLFFSQSDGSGTACNAGIDFVQLVCRSGLTPQISQQNVSNGQYNFSGSSNNVAGLTAATYCWDFGDGTTATGQNVSHTYSNPSNYKVCLTVTDNCGCVNTVCQSLVYCVCAENSTVLPPGVQNYSGAALVERDLILPPGTHLTISNQTLQINTGCKFVVMRGASLTVDNSTLAPACDGRWQGIIVWGNSNQNHNINYRLNPQNTPIDGPGVVRVRSNSHIEGANTALEPQRWWSDPRNDAIYAAISGTTGPIPSFWGGQIFAVGSIFFNNRKSGDIGTYPGNNLGLFSECTFTSSNPVTGNNGLEGVNLWNTNGVRFEGCTFDMVPARGITTIDAGITVYRTTFQNNYQGIKVASVTNPLSNTIIGDLEINRNYFISNAFGISSDGITGLRVRRNSFGSNARAGIAVSGNSSFRVEGNVFSGHPFGVDLLNTGFVGQHLNCNSHQDDRAIRVMGYCRGVQFNDNTFDNQTADLYMGQSGGLLGDIFPNQGSNGAARLNLFSENEGDNDIVTEPGETVFFRYYPPTGDEFTPAELARMLPDCDDDDGCAVPNNYHNEPASKPYSDCDLPQSPPGGGDALPCANRDCLDSLNTRLAWLNQQIAAGQSQHQADAAATELRFVDDKINLVGQWLAEGNISLIEQTLNAYNTLADQQLLFAVYTKRGNLSGAAALLTAMPESTEPEQWYKSTQGTYLQYLAAPGQYQAGGFTATSGPSFLVMSIINRWVRYMLCVFLSIYMPTLKAQDWESLGDFKTIDDLRLFEIYPDTIDNLLYIGGQFKVIYGTTYENIAAYDGHKYHYIADSINACWNLGCSGVASIARYRDGIVSSLVRSSTYEATPQILGMGRWDGQKWHPLGEGIADHYDSGLQQYAPCTLWDFCIYDDTLYVAGDMDYVGGMPSNASCAAWDGQHWITFPQFGLPLGGAFLTTSIAKYKGKMYLGGNSRVIINGEDVNDLICLNGTTWEKVGDGLIDGWTNLRDMEVFQDKLYVAGYFAQADGNPGNSIMSWDGERWNDLGGGVCSPFGAIDDLFVYKDKLYVAGLFTCIGGIEANNVASWDGSRWCSVGSSVFDGPIHAVAVWHDTVYVGGSFSEIDGQPARLFARYVGDPANQVCSAPISSAPEPPALPHLRLSPNPASGQVTVTLSGAQPAGLLRVVSMLGAVLGAVPVSGSQTMVSTADLPAGFYFIRQLAHDGHLVATARLVVQH